MRAPVLASLLLVAACSSQGDGPTYECDGKCDGASSDPMWTDKVFQEAAAVLGRERGVSFRYALDRAVNTLGNYNVQPYPSVSCNGGPEQLWWNGEDHAFSRLGIVGVADMVALEAISREGGAEWHVKFLASAPGGDGDAKKALDVIASIGSPKLLLAAVTALADNGRLSAGVRRTLIAFEAEMYATKQFRAADLSLRLPDLAHPVSASAVLDALRAAPVPSYRIALVDMLAHDPSAASPGEIDALLVDDDVLVRTAAMKLFWKSGNVSAARQSELLAWMYGTEAKRQLRLKFLGVSTDAEAAGWAAEPDGFVPYYQEQLAEFVGAAINAAGPGDDFRPFLAKALAFQHISNIVEDTTRALFRSTVLSAQEKEQAIVQLVPAAINLRYDGITTTAAMVFRVLARSMLAAPRTDLVALTQQIYVPATVDRAAMTAQLSSNDAATRLAGLKAFAQWEPGFMAAVFDAGAGSDALLANQDGYVMLAALENGTSPQLVIDKVLGFATTHYGDPEPYLELWNGSEYPYVQALAAALASPALSTQQRIDNLVKFAHVISPRNAYFPTGAPGPGALYLGQDVFDILALLDDPQITAAQREQAWRDILVRGNGPALRNHLLDMTPFDGPIRSLVQTLVRPTLVQTAITCWTGHSDPANERPGLSVGLIPFALATATAPVEPEEVVDARIDTLRGESGSAAALPAGATVDALLATHPVAKNAYYGAWPYDKPERELYELPAADLATRFAAVTNEQLWPLTTALALAPDLDALPAAALAQVDATLASKFPTTTQPSFMLHLARGEGYDALAVAFRSTIALRWDLADAVRSQGETAALERLLATADRTFGVVPDLTYLAARTAGRAAVSDAFRLSLAGASADGLDYWTTGPMPLVRMRGSLLETAVLDGAAWRTSQPQNVNLPPSHLMGSVVSDPRLSADAALHLAWLTLSAGRFHPGDFDQKPATITWAIDMTLGVMARGDISAADKQTLGKALSTVLE